jgi:hypothetical protein
MGTLLGSGHSPGNSKWQAAAPAGGIINTSDVELAAAVAGRQAFCSAIQVIDSDATVDTEVVIKDGSTIIWRMFMPAARNANGFASPVSFEFPTPLRTSVNTALNVAAITTSAELYVNAQGYYA